MQKNLLFSLLASIHLSAIAFARNPDTPFDHITKGDKAYSRFDNETALNEYTNAFELDSMNYEAAWKLARAYMDIGESLKDQKKRKVNFQEGEKYARRAIKISPDSTWGHLFLSVALGRIALDAGAKERVKLAEEIKIEVDRTLELDPNNDFAWHVLGRWHRKVAATGRIERFFAKIFYGGIPKGASFEKAAECFQKAIEINPEWLNHHLELGLTYEKLNEDHLAIEEYEKVLELPITDAEDEIHKLTAKNRLKKLK